MLCRLHIRRFLGFSTYINEEPDWAYPLLGLPGWNFALCVPIVILNSSEWNKIGELAV